MDNIESTFSKLSKYSKEFVSQTQFINWFITADKTVLYKKEICKYNYSNLGILLVALSLKYYYNKKK
jgi:hypothetical protein